jgi:DNA-directed RNA polymerase subunit RPC12/RpoP
MTSKNFEYIIRCSLRDAAKVMQSHEKRLVDIEQFRDGIKAQGKVDATNWDLVKQKQELLSRAWDEIKELNDIIYTDGVIRERLKAKVNRLTARGIEDMLNEITELKAKLEEALKAPHSGDKTQEFNHKNLLNASTELNLIKAELELHKAPPSAERVCEFTILNCKYLNYFDTGCGATFATGDKLEDSEYQYCPYCGGKIQAPPSAELTQLLEDAANALEGECNEVERGHVADRVRDYQIAPPSATDEYLKASQALEPDAYAPSRDA